MQDGLILFLRYVIALSKVDADNHIEQSMASEIYWHTGNAWQTVASFAIPSTSPKFPGNESLSGLLSQSNLSVFDTSLPINSESVLP